MANLIIAESFRRFFELNKSKSRIAEILLDDIYTCTEFGNYIARRGDMISFLPAGKEHQVNPDSGDWKRENRQTAKAGKLARKLIKEEDKEGLELKDTDYELFSNLIKADKINDEDCQVKFIEVSGKDIKYRYSEDNHSEKYSLGSMGDSCMRYNSCQHYLDIYTQNPDAIGLLVMTDTEDKTVGRAIVWQTNDGVFMDRVYASDAHQKMFENYAENKEWMYKSLHNNDQDTRIVKNGESERRYPVVQLSCWEFDYYPYMDTMCYLSGTGKISNDSGYNDKELRETCGGITNGEDNHDGEMYDDYDDEWINEDDAVEISGLGYTHRDNTVLDDYTDNYILENRAQRLENGKWCHEDDAVETEDGWYHKNDLDDFEQINGMWYNRENDCVMDELTEEYILDKEAVELHDGGKTHEDGNIRLLDSSYGDKQYAKRDECFSCPYSDTWFLIEDGVMLYSGKRVSNENMEAYLQEHSEEITIADNQLTMNI